MKKNSKSIISIQKLAKAYTISHQIQAVGTSTLRDALIGTLRRPLSFFTGERLDKEKFWALKNVSLEIEQGDTVGLIGRNGSGKSTLLKVLSRIVEPTSGRAMLNGRTASLLEVGTGFHPELTGRENIFFNGAILGMSRKEINQKFDEIVEFSGVEKFLDTPVKFYSSGMYVRLAFAIAAHLDPDILIVDEVLAVGDAEFQKKSLGKMRDVTQDATRTVIFVSHSMEAIQSICNKCIWMQNGEIMKYGPTKEVVEAYMQQSNATSQTPISKRTNRKGTGSVKLTDAKLHNNVIKSGEIMIDFMLTNKSKNTYDDIKFSLDLRDTSGNHIANIMNQNVGKSIRVKPGKTSVSLQIENVRLMPGSYSLSTFLASDVYNTEIFDWVEDAVTLTIPAYDVHNQGSMPANNGGIIYLDYDYKT